MKKFDKIIFLTANYPYGKGETYIDNEINYLKGACNRLLVIPTKQVKQEKSRLPMDEDTQVILMKRNIGNYLLPVVKLLLSNEVRYEIYKLIKEGKFNVYTFISIVYFYIKGQSIISRLDAIINDELKCGNNLIYSYWSGTTAYVSAELKMKYSNCTCITRAHRYDIYQERLAPYYIPFKEKTFQTMKGVFAVSEHGKYYLQKMYPQIKDKFCTAYLGTLDRGINPNKKNDFFTIVSSSNVIFVKRIDLIINALRKMKCKVNWTHYGDGELLEEMQSLAESLPPNIHYKFQGRVKNNELLKLYGSKHIDLFINVSDSEGLPVSIMEAISFGIPVIATDVGGSSEIVKNNFNGLLIKANCSEDEIVDKINKIVNMPEKDMQSMRKNARKFWEKNFMADRNYKMFFCNLLKE